MGIPAALFYKERTLWLSQQPYCSRTEPMGITAGPLYNDTTFWVSQQPYYTGAVSY